MVFSWFTTQRRNRLLAEPVPPAWTEHLAKNVRHYERLSPRQQSRVCQVVQVLSAEKNWVGGSGFEVADEMKVTVAGQAAILTLGQEEPYFFDAVQTIILYCPYCGASVTEEVDDRDSPMSKVDSNADQPRDPFSGDCSR